MPQKDSKRGQKLYYYLSHLSAKELKDFHSYLSSPLLGNSPQMARMLLLIQSQVLDQGLQFIAADIFKPEFFPDEALDAKKRQYIRIRLVSFLDKLEAFLAFMDYRRDTNAQDLHLLRSLHVRGLGKYIVKTFEEIEAKPPKKEHGEYHIYRMRRAIVLNDYLTMTTNNSRESRLEETVDKVNYTTTFLALKYGHSAVNANQLWDANIATPYLELSLKLTHEYQPTNDIEIPAYANALRLCKPEEFTPEQFYHEFTLAKLQLFESNEFDNSEAKDLFGFAINTAIARIRLGESVYSQELASIYEETLNRKVFCENGLMPDRVLENMIARMLLHHNLDWCNRTFEEWKDKLLGEDTQLAKDRIAARIHIYCKRFNEAIRILIPHTERTINANTGLSIRIELSRAIWGLKEYEWLLNTLASMRTFMSREKKELGQRRMNLLRHNQLFARLARANTHFESKRREKILRLKEEMVKNKEDKIFPWLYNVVISQLSE